MPSYWQLDHFSISASSDLTTWHFPIIWFPMPSKSYSDNNYWRNQIVHNARECWSVLYTKLCYVTCSASLSPCNYIINNFKIFAISTPAALQFEYRNQTIQLCFTLPNALKTRRHVLFFKRFSKALWLFWTARKVTWFLVVAVVAVLFPLTLYWHVYWHWT